MVHCLLADFKGTTWCAKLLGEGFFVQNRFDTVVVNTDNTRSNNKLLVVDIEFFFNGQCKSFYNNNSTNAENGDARYGTYRSAVLESESLSLPGNTICPIKKFKIILGHGRVVNFK